MWWAGESIRCNHFLISKVTCIFTYWESSWRCECWCFYAPNFEEVEGAYWFGSARPVQSVCDARVTLSTRSGTVRARILKFSYVVCIWKLRGPIFLLSGKFKGLGLHSVRVISLFNSWYNLEAICTGDATTIVHYRKNHLCVVESKSR